MRLAEDSLSWKIHLFLKVLPRNPDHRLPERNGTGASPRMDTGTNRFVQPPIQVGLLRLGVGSVLFVEPVRIEDEFNGRNGLGFVDDEAEHAVWQGRGDKFLYRPSPVELKSPF